MARDAAFAFLPDGGETGALVRSMDWSKHPLGAPQTWPAPLRVALGIVFGSRHPMFLWWGAELYQFYNDAYMPSFGRGKHPAAMGQRGSDCWPEIWPIIWPQISNVLTRGEASWNEDSLVPVLRNGRIEDAYWTYGYSPVYDEEGTVGGVLVVCTETTERVLATRALEASRDALLVQERAVRAARQELQSFLMQAPVGIAILRGREHVYSFINPMFMKLLFRGRPASDLLTKPVRVALPELRGQGFFEILDGVYQTGKPFTGAKIRASMLQADGQERAMFVNFTYQAKYDDHGQIDGVLAVIYEVTDQVNEQLEIEVLADNLRAAITSRDTFLAIASHELNTPLTALKLKTQLSRRQIHRSGDSGVASDRHRAFIESVDTQVRRLERLVSDMLDVSRLSSGNFSVVRAPCDLSALVVEMLAHLAAQIEAAGCVLSTSIAPQVLALLDAPRIEQAFINLVTNALKYAPGSPLYVEVRTVGHTARVTVRDYGPGIAPDDLQRLFGCFERAAAARQVSGLGLGLYICQQIIAQHGGRVDVTSVLGEGATFIIELPATSPA